METFTDIIDLWPSTAVLAEDLGEKPARVRKWRQRNSIPSSEWVAIIDAAKRRKLRGVTAEKLTQLASRN